MNSPSLESADQRSAVSNEGEAFYLFSFSRIMSSLQDFENLADSSIAMWLQPMAIEELRCFLF
jgi:hypothetical protein